jgi:acyl-CoA thioesterase
MTFPLADFLGMSFEPLEPGHAKGRIDIGDNHLNPHGVAHGGVAAALIDTTMGAAVQPMLDGNLRCSTVEMQIRYLRPVGRTTLTAEARVLKPGRRIFQVECRVTDAVGKLVASGTGTFAVIE